MASFSPNTSLNRSYSPSSGGVLERSLLLQKKRISMQQSLFWLTINAILLAIIIYDLSQTCPMFMSYYHYIEYSFTIIFTLNIIYYLAKIVRLYFQTRNQIAVTVDQKKLLGIDEKDQNYVLTAKSTPQKTFARSAPTTPRNVTALSWQSDSIWNYSISPPIIAKPKQENSDDYYRFTKKDEGTEDSFAKEDLTKPNSSLLSSFWSHPIARSNRDLVSSLSKTIYQLSTPSPTKSSTYQSSPLQLISDELTTNEAFSRINVDTIALTQWNENLRIWISKTILDRLIKEFQIVDEGFEKHNMGDIKIGDVGLDRLRKIVQSSQIAHFIPSLNAIIPFLELHSNQEYLVKRIKELNSGGCMSEFSWNSGGKINGREWDDSLPTDCAVVMHLLAAYLDTQLLPTPSRPDLKPFSGRYFLKANEKMPALDRYSLFIQEVQEKPPHYRVIVQGKIYEMVKGYNNLFHTILFFLYHVHKLEQGMLGRVNLGRAGVNILWILGVRD